jgi:hypothetical protein
VGIVKGSHGSKELPIQTITTIDFDIAKSVFQVPRTVKINGNWHLADMISHADDVGSWG